MSSSSSRFSPVPGGERSAGDRADQLGAAQPAAEGGEGIAAAEIEARVGPWAPADSIAPEHGVVEGRRDQVGGELGVPLGRDGDVVNGVEEAAGHPA